MKYIRKIIYASFLMVITILSMTKVEAAQLNVTVSSSASTVVVGNTVTYTVNVSSSSLLGGLVYAVNYDTSKLTLTSGTQAAALPFTGKEKSATYTFQFKAKSSGTANFNFVVNDAVDWNGTAFSFNKTTSKSIKIITQQELEASYSKNNYLSSLGVDGMSISPNFNKNTMEYSLTVENDVRKINVSGQREDSKSSVSGLGEHELSEGMNRIEIKVTAQNGSSRTYVLNVTVKELSPITVMVRDETYNVVRKKEELTSPNSTYEESTTKVQGEEVPCFVNNITHVTLLGLKDKEGKIALYRYENDTFELYQEFASKSVIVTEKPLENIPQGYHETKLEIGGKQITAYQNNNSSNFYLIYATNIENGTTSLYQYDSKENTFQLYNSLSMLTLQRKNKYCEYIIIGLGSILAVTYIGLLISQCRKKGKKGKKKEANKVEERMATDEEVQELMKKIDNKDEEDNDKIEQNRKEEKKKKQGKQGTKKNSKKK